MDAQDLDRWVGSIGETMTETSELLGLGTCTPREALDGLPSGLAGAHMSITGSTGAIHLGVLAPLAAHQQIAKRMLAMEIEDEDLPVGDLADAVGEIANIIAGGVKSALSEWDDDLRLGLPVFIEGNIERSAGVAARTLRFDIDGAQVSVVVLVQTNAQDKIRFGRSDAA